MAQIRVTRINQGLRLDLVDWGGFEVREVRDTHWSRPWRRMWMVWLGEELDMVQNSSFYF